MKHIQYHSTALEDTNMDWHTDLAAFGRHDETKDVTTDVLLLQGT